MVIQKSRQRGFSLLELLLVIAIIGVVSAFGLSSFRAESERARINQAAAQVVADLQRARSASQRYNQDASFSINATTTDKYELVIGGVTSKRTLPTGAQLSAANAFTLKYSAPFGEVRDAIPSTITVKLAGRDTKPRYIKVLGVTGKVILSAVQ